MPRPDPKYRLIVFDWDGTLMDSAGGIVACIQEASREMGLPVPTRDRASHVIGLGLHDSLRFAVPELPESRYAAFAVLYRKHFLARETDMTLFPGVSELLTDLRDAGYALAVATGKSRQGLDRALDASGLRPYFAASRCADETNPKPNPAMLHELMAELSHHPDDLVMVGDTCHDLDMAASAGVDAVAVTHGAHTADVLRARSPKGIVADIAGLGVWLTVICASADLVDAGLGVRFETGHRGQPAAAFAIRYEGVVHAYLNRCSHVAMELDWQPGAFFDAEGRDLICSTHGALYSASSGKCLGGPCAGGPLVKLAVEERDGCIMHRESSDG